MHELYSPLQRQAETIPDRLAIDGVAKISYSALEHSASQLSTFLKLSGVKPKTLVILNVPGAMTIAFEWACWKIGAVVCEYSKQVTYEFAETKVLVTNTEIETSLKTIAINQEILREINSLPTNELKPYLYGADELAQVLLSSGTTGNPKPIAISALQVLERARLGDAAWASGKQSICTMNRGTVAWANYKMFTILNGHTILITANPEMLTTLIDQYKIESLMASPITLKSTLDYAASNNSKMTSLEKIYVGGGKTPSKLADRAASYARVINIYGSTEAGSISSKEFSANSNSVGKPFEDVEIQILDQQGSLVPANSEGIVRYRRPTMTAGYLDQSDGMIDGWFYPGDLGKINLEGELEILGRVSESVSIGGVKINLAELDHRFEKVQGIDDLASFSYEQNDEANLGVAVVAGKGFDPQRVSNELFALVNFPKIASVFQLAEIPRNDNGKTLREEISEKFTQRLSKDS